MAAAATFSEIGQEICVRVDLTALSGRDRCRILRTLLQDAGVIEELVRAGHGSAINVIDAGMQRLWDCPAGEQVTKG